MYTPSHNRQDDRAQLLEFMRQYSFAVLVSSAADGGGMQATHLPVLVEERGGDLVLVAHLARANPQWRTFAGGGEVLAIFHGPHAFVSPSLYEKHPSVPTWNYVAVHAYGVPRLLETDADKRRVLSALIEAQDRPYLERFEALPADFAALKLAGIVAFEIPVTRLDARYKLSQDRGAGERANIVASLAASTDSAAFDLAAYMREPAS